MSAGSNLSGLQPLGARKLPPQVMSAVANEMSDFDLVPDKSSRGQEMLSPLVARSRPNLSSFDVPNPITKPSFGKNTSNKAIGLAPLGAAPHRNLINDFTDSNDPLQKSLKQKKSSLAPMSSAHSQLGAALSLQDQEAPPQPSPVKRRVGANRIISPMAARHTEVPMHILGVSRSNLSHSLRRPMGGLVKVSDASHNTDRKVLNLDGAFPDDDDFHKTADDFQKTLRDTNLLNETGHRMKNMLGGGSEALLAELQGSLSLKAPPSSLKTSVRDSLQESLSRREEEEGAATVLRKSLRRREPEHDPWSTTSGSAYVY